jgi:cell division transport system ATP-binding protein
MIVFEKVSKRYANGREALKDVSFNIHTGEMVFLTGRSGAGKSTVLKLIALLERPSRGTVLVNGKNTRTLKHRHIAAFRRRIGVVFQDHKLLADRPVFDNVALPLAVAGAPLKEIDKRVRAALDQVGLLGRERSLPLELSVGEQQRVGIARAVVSKPPLLIADEPTGNLDPDLSLEVMRLFRRFQDVGVTVVIATHDLHIVREFGQRVITLEGGHLQDGEAPDALPSVVATR